MILKVHHIYSKEADSLPHRSVKLNWIISTMIPSRFGLTRILHLLRLFLLYHFMFINKQSFPSLGGRFGSELGPRDEENCRYPTWRAICWTTPSEAVGWT